MMKKMLFCFLALASFSFAWNFNFNENSTIAARLGYGFDFNGNKEKTMGSSGLGLTVYENPVGLGYYIDLSYIGFEANDISGYDGKEDVDMDEDIISVVLGRNHFYSEKLYLAPRVGVSYVKRDIDGKKYKDKKGRITPLIGVSAESNLTDKWFARATTDFIVVAGAPSSIITIVSVGYKF